MASPARPLAHPPSTKPFRTKAYPGGTFYRVHRFDAATGKYAADAFNDTARGNSGKVVPTIYAAQTRRGAIAEIVLHDVPTPSAGHLHDWEQDKEGDLHLSEIELATGIELVNLTTTGLRAAGLDPADLFQPDVRDYPRTQAWGFHIWQQYPHAKGLAWMSVRDNTCLVVMLFGDRVSTGDLSHHGVSAPIASYEADVLLLLDELGCGIVIP